MSLFIDCRRARGATNHHSIEPIHAVFTYLIRQGLSLEMESYSNSAVAKSATFIASTASVRTASSLHSRLVSNV